MVFICVIVNLQFLVQCSSELLSFSWVDIVASFGKAIEGLEISTSIWRDLG